MIHLADHPTRLQCTQTCRRWFVLMRVERTILNSGDIFSAAGLGDSDSYHDTNRFGKFVPPSGS